MTPDDLDNDVLRIISDYEQENGVTVVVKDGFMPSKVQIARYPELFRTDVEWLSTKHAHGSVMHENGSFLWWGVFRRWVYTNKSEIVHLEDVFPEFIDAPSKRDFDTDEDFGKAKAIFLKDETEKDALRIAWLKQLVKQAKATPADMLFLAETNQVIVEVQRLELREEFKIVPVGTPALISMAAVYNRTQKRSMMTMSKELSTEEYIITNDSTNRLKYRAIKKLSTDEQQAFDELMEKAPPFDAPPEPTEQRVRLREKNAELKLRRLYTRWRNFQKPGACREPPAVAS